MLNTKYIDFYHNDEEGGCCGRHHESEGEHHCCGHHEDGEHHCHGHHDHGEGEHHCCGHHEEGGHHCHGHHAEAIPADRVQALMAYMINHNTQHAFEIRNLEDSVSENAAILMEQAVKAMAISIDFLQDALSIIQSENSEEIKAEKARADAEYKEE